MRLLSRLRRRAEPELVDVPDAAPAGGLDPAPRRLPDPSKPSEARGSWEQAALVNIGITEQVKRELDAVTPPWRK